jgi:hypothetical protein
VEWICQVEREALPAEELLTLHKSASPSSYYEDGDFAGPGSPLSLSHAGNSASALASSTLAKSASTNTKDSHSKSASHKSKLEATPSNCAKPAASLRGCLSPPLPQRPHTLATDASCLSQVLKSNFNTTLLGASGA